jgi:hypothetical protein
MERAMPRAAHNRQHSPTFAKSQRIATPVNVQKHVLLARQWLSPSGGPVRGLRSGHGHHKAMRHSALCAFIRPLRDLLALSLDVVDSAQRPSL